MSKDTIAPISYVPLVILSINGKPFMQYKGPYDINEIKRFVLEVAQKVNNKQKFSNETTKEDTNKKGIPEFTIGHPLYGEDNVTYLHFEDAYGAETKQ